MILINLTIVNLYKFINVPQIIEFYMKNQVQININLFINNLKKVLHKMK